MGKASYFTPSAVVTSTPMSNLSPSTTGAPNKVASCVPVTVMVLGYVVTFAWIDFTTVLFPFFIATTSNCFAGTSPLKNISTVTLPLNALGFCADITWSLPATFATTGKGNLVNVGIFGLSSFLQAWKSIAAVKIYKPCNAI